MAFPNLVLKTGGYLAAQATGTPDNGHNSFDVGIAASQLDPNWLDILVTSLGASIIDCTFVSLVGTVLTLNFSQSGGDQATVLARVSHSLVR